MEKPPPPLTLILESCQERSLPLWLPPLGSAALQVVSSGPFHLSPEPPRGLAVEMSAAAPLQPTNLGQRAFSVRVSQCKSRQCSRFSLVLLFGPRAATGQPHSGNFHQPEGKGPFCGLLRSIWHRPRRMSQVGHRIGGSVASVARGPASSCESPGSGGRGRPSFSPGHVCVARAAPPSSMPAAPLVAGVRAREPADLPLRPRALTRSAPAGAR